MNRILKKILIGLGILVALFLVANGVVAFVPSVRDAIEGLPLQDQILFLANEIDSIKREQACQRADILLTKALRDIGISGRYTTFERWKTYFGEEDLGNLEKFMSYYNQYLREMSDCSPNQ